MGRETLEPQELAEVEEPERRALQTRVAVSVAVLAMLTSIAVLQSEHSATASLLQKNDAVLVQSQASDQWALRQAKSIKLHVQELAPGGGKDADADRQRADIAAAEELAREFEARRDEANRASGEEFERHHRFSIATSLLQISIVLETVAVVVDRRSVWWGGLMVGTAGALALANGFLGLV